jgi:PAS domain S-box-containing protein
MVVLRFRRVPTVPLSHDSQLIDALFENLPGLVYVIDERGVVVHYNQGYRSILGYDAAELAGTNAFAIAAPEDRERLIANFQRLEVAPNESHLVQVLARDGQRIPMFFSAKRVTIGESRYIIGTGVDAREQLEIQRALRNSEQRYRSIFDATSDLLVICDTKGTVIDVNERVESLFGCSRAEFLDGLAAPSSLNGDDSDAKDLQRHIQLAATEGARVFEWKTQHVKGDSSWFEVTLRDLEFEGEHRIVAAARDITARKAAEEASRAGEAQDSAMVATSCSG